MMTALELCEDSQHLVEVLEGHLVELSKEAATIRQQVVTSKQHGLGAAIAAPDFLKKLIPHLTCIEAVAKRAIEQIETAEVD